MSAINKYFKNNNVCENKICRVYIINNFKGNLTKFTDFLKICRIRIMSIRS